MMHLEVLSRKGLQKELLRQRQGFVVSIHFIHMTSKDVQVQHLFTLGDSMMLPLH